VRKDRTQRGGQPGVRARTAIVFAIGFPEDILQPLPVHLVAEADERVVHVDDANEFGSEQVALRVVGSLNRFAIALRFIASHS